MLRLTAFVLSVALLAGFAPTAAAFNPQPEPPATPYDRAIDQEYRNARDAAHRAAPGVYAPEFVDLPETEAGKTLAGLLGLGTGDFNPQPEPPALPIEHPGPALDDILGLGWDGFNPQPEPPALPSG